ncbi:S1 domain-containing post-transcriptional regulator Ygs [Staphylococcus equorum]|uniref:S1 domain-containing post-transcriptional regulator Ygs n=1 Tax=Staphylococcus equorum TaxID=246432 RepID=UPI0021BF076E|nr:S1 domain-containing post-transcriptional regulator Ygs [Staphylococcus equorum]
MNNHYTVGQHIKVRVTGIQPYGAFVETPDNAEGLIHISEIMDDYVHNLKKFLSEGQIVRAKVISIDDEGKLNLSLKDNDYFKNYERKKEKQSVLDEIKETEKYGFQTIKERLPVWIKQSKNAIKDEKTSLTKY